MNISYLLFALSDRVFGVRLSGAKEIFPWRKPRPVPLSYSYVAGLIDYRGTVYPVYNLEHRMGLKRPGPIGFAAKEPASEEPMKNRSIILLEEKGTPPVGIIVDSVLKMTSLEEPAEKPKKSEGIDPAYIRGIVKADDQDVILLDMEKVIHAG